MAESNFSPTWRYNPIKRQLQIWTSPVEALVFEESLLKAISAMGLWRNCHHEALLKLPISTR
jgi:hypothetical protein